MELCGYHEELGYDNFYECIEKNFHMDKSAVSRVISVWNEFCSKDDADSRKMWIDDRYEKYSYSQLVEMLPLKEQERRRVTSDMTVSQIRNYKKSLKEQTYEKEKSVATSNQRRRKRYRRMKEAVLQAKIQMEPVRAVAVMKQ